MYEKDEGKIAYSFATSDLPLDSADWIPQAKFEAENFTDPVMETQVWCRVTAGSNYYPTNDNATVTILEVEKGTAGNVPASEESKEAVGGTLGPIVDALLDTPGSPIYGKPFGKLQVNVNTEDGLENDGSTQTSKDDFISATNEMANSTVMASKMKNYTDTRVFSYDIVLEVSGNPEVERTGYDYDINDWTKVGEKGEHGNAFVLAPIPYHKPDESKGEKLIGIFYNHNGSVYELPKSTCTTLAALTNVHNTTRSYALSKDLTDVTEVDVVYLWVDEFSAVNEPLGIPVPANCQGICSWVELNGADPAAGVIVYDFQAMLRTTRGVPGFNTFDTTTVQLGQNVLGAFWYDENTIINGNNIDSGTLFAFTDDAAGTVTGTAATPYDIRVPNAVTAMTATGRHLVIGAFANAQYSIDGGTTWAAMDAELAKRDFGNYLLNVVVNPYNLPKPSTGAYCAIYTYRTVNPASCYRMPGMRMLTGTYVLNDCCCGNPEGGHFVDRDGLLPDLWTEMLYLFGSQTYNLANQVEIVGRIGTDGVPGVPAFHFAGHGNLSTVWDSARNRSRGIVQVSGNIVGYLPPSRCIYFCCRADERAGAFQCNNNVFNNALTETAAFGTFTMRYSQLKTTIPVTPVP